jgi:proteasome accessory factor A
VSASKSLRGNTSKRQGLSRRDLLADTVLANGARFYNDHNHPEYCTDACLSLRELVAQDKAGERIVLRAQQERNAAIGQADHVRLIKNNSDYHGRSYGCHENYLVSRSVPMNDLVAACIPFFVTRQIYAGAGKAAQETANGRTGGFQISQRADFFETDVGINTTTKRPIFNTRDEPHADPRKYRRLHVIIGDANCSEYATALRVGATALMLDLLEEGAAPQVQLQSPVQALQTISRDLQLTLPLALADGATIRAIDIQRRYWEAAQRYNGRDAETDWVLDEWDSVLGLLDTDATRLRDRLDWVAKLALFAQMSGGDAINWDDPSVVRLDLAYHLVDPDVSLYHTLAKAGRMQRLVTDQDITRAETTPPAGTRAMVRAACLTKFAEHITAMEWGSITFQHNGAAFILELDELWGTSVEKQRATVAACRTIEDLHQAVQRGGET